MQLTNQDLKNLVEFSIEINSNFHDFENAVLRGLKTYFGYSISNYNIADDRPDGSRYLSRCYSNYFRESDIDFYLQLDTSNDEFVCRGEYYRAKNALKYVFCREICGENPVTKSFTRYGLKYQALLGSSVSSKVPVHSLAVYRTEEEGPFDEYELTRLNEVARVFSETMSNYKRYLREKKTAELFSYYLDTQGSGTLIYAPRLKILKYNQQFLSFGIQISAESTIEGIMNELLGQARGCNSELPRNTAICFPIDDFEIKVQKHILEMNQDEFRTINTELQAVYFIEICPKNAEMQQAKLPSKRELFLSYELTEREAEVAELLLAGMNNMDISEQLVVSIATVKTHVRNIFSKMDVRTRREFMKKFV